MPHRLKIHLALFAVASLFSANYIISKLAMNTLSPLSFAWLRVFGSALLLNIIVRGRGDFRGKRRRELIGLAVLTVVISQAFFLAGLSLTSAHVAAILITTIPVFALASAIVLGRERATRTKIAGIALAMGGALLVLGGEGLQASGRTFLGALLIIVNCLAYALYLVLSKPIMERASPTLVVARMFAWGTILMLPVSGWSLVHEPWRAIPAGTWISLLVVIIGPTVGAYVLSGWALRHADSSLVAAYTYVQPVMATILAALILGEHVEGTVALAAVMIFFGVALAGRQPGPIPE